MDVQKSEVAVFVRRFLRQQAFKTKAKRMGKVVRVAHVGISVWHVRAEEETFLRWE